MCVDLSLARRLRGLGRLAGWAGVVALLWGCPAAPLGDVAKLEELGYFAYTPPEKLAAAREAAAGPGFPFYDEGSGRFFWADAETLAEGGVGSFLGELAPTLEQIGVRLGELSESWDEAYSVRVAGREVLIYGPEEQEEARALAAVRTFALVNDLLAAAGSAERLYAVGGDNDMVAVLLTPDLLELLSARAEVESWRPYLPTEDPPWYGMPHAGSS